MRKIGVLILICFLLLIISCEKNSKLRIGGSFSEFTTDISVIIYNVSPKDTSKAIDAIEKSREILAYFNSEMNVYNENSALSMINSAEAGVKTKIPGSLTEILEISKNIHEYTDGAFDIAAMPLVELWNESIRETGTIPSEHDISRVIGIANLDCFIFDNDSLIKTDLRCKIGLGGIAKGYAVDSVSAYLKSRGFTDHIVDAGGDMTINSQSQRMVGITHPRIPGEIIDTIYVASGSVASSGDYEKYIEHDGLRYSHIINPATGYSLSDCIAVTVITEKAYLSDAFATAVLVMGKDKGHHFLIENDLSGIIYYLDESGEVDRLKINMYGYMSKKGGGGLK